MTHPSSSSAPSPSTGKSGLGLLDLVERIGNKLPDPVFLFLGCAIAVVLLSAIGSALGWEVQPLRPAVVTTEVLGGDGKPVLDATTGQPLTQPVLNASGRPLIETRAEGEPLRPRSLLSSAGLYWMATNAVRNFINFPPLGIVLTAMLGIGLAERVGFFGAAMKWLAGVTPSVLLTPTIVFLGVLSSVASDAGYIVLPPLAAALYLAVGRPPVAGIAAAFAGVSAGFSANLFPSAGDALVAGLTTTGAQVLEPGYEVNPLCNWWFMIGSTFVLTLTGWFVTARIVEPRLRTRPPELGGPREAAGAELESQLLSAQEKRGLLWALGGIALVLAGLAAMILIEGAPLYGRVDPDRAASAPRWTQAIVPIILVAFLAPGLAYGFVTGALKSTVDVSKAFIHSMAGMAPIVVLAFFAAQFIAFLGYSNLDRMLAFLGGKALLELGLPRDVLVVGVVILSLVLNLFIGSMSAKWAMLAPIIVPMLMMVGISPELTQAAYRVGDSVTNVITPLNSYLLIVLVVLQKYVKNAGVGSLLALMLPYSIVFAVVWTGFLMLWIWTGKPLGVGGDLVFVPGVTGN